MMEQEYMGYIIEEHYDNDNLVGISAHKDFSDGSFDVIYDKGDGEPDDIGYVSPSVERIQKMIDARLPNGIILSHYYVIAMQFPTVRIAESYRKYHEGDAEGALSLLHLSQKYPTRAEDWISSLAKHLIKFTKENEAWRLSSNTKVRNMLLHQTTENT